VGTILLYIRCYVVQINGCGKFEINYVKSAYLSIFYNINAIKVIYFTMSKTVG